MYKIENIVFAFITVMLFIIPRPSLFTQLDYLIFIPVLILYITRNAISHNHLSIFFIAMVLTLPGLLVSGNTFPILLALNMICVFYFTKRKPNCRSKNINVIFLSILIFSILYLIDSSIFRIRADGRYHLNHSDPNFSSVGIFLLFAFFMSLRKYYFCLALFVLATILMSRAALLSIIIYVILSKSKFISQNYFYKKITTNMGVIAIISIFILFLSVDFIQGFLGEFSAETSTGAGRLTNFADNSNIGRFIKFAITFEMMRDFQYLLNGPGLELYGSIVPHNSLMFIFANFGLLSLAAHLIFLTAIKNINTNQRALSAAMIFYSMFLHGLLLGLYFVAFVFIHHKLAKQPAASVTSI
mgnify:CR=1 FL=1